ncbi:hypothetical protein [Bacillus sp. SM2101]|uniref:hypothetical protein n=1 Tax=Bacillus sp. SM2101 TaxID=2805366 RepID=UPI001BDED7D1|nr:hypothetical protein [Bacillus sp. SM2101]
MIQKLIVDDDASIRELRHFLQTQGFAITGAANIMVTYDQRMLDLSDRIILTK